MPKKTTSIKIDPDVWKEARIYAIGKGTNISELVETLLKKEISKGKKD